MRQRLLYTLLSCFVLLPLYAEPNPPLPAGTYTIQHIHVLDAQGQPPPPATTQHILQLLDIPLGTTLTFPNERINQALTHLWQRGYAIEINAQPHEDHTLALQLIILQQHPLLHTVHWKGFSRKAQQHLAQQLNLSPGQPWRPHLQETLEVYLENYLRNKGYRHAHVTLRTQPTDHHQVDLYIHARKRTKYYVGHIHFDTPTPEDTYALAQHLPYSRQGTLPHHNTWSQRLLQNILRCHFHTLLPDIARFHKSHSPPFIENKVQQDTQQLIQYYRTTQGYLDATVHYTLQENDNQVNITFHIDPGDIYTLENIQWRGNTHLSTQTINQGLNIHLGEPYRPAHLAAALIPSPTRTTLHTLYQQTQAPVWVSADLRIQGIQDHHVSLEGHIQEYPYPTITHIHHRTTHKLNPTILHTILAAHDIAVGQPLTQANLLACKQHLAQTGLFQPETIALKATPTGPQQVSVELYAIETKKIDFQAGLENDRFKLSLQYPNFDLQKFLQGQTPTGQGQTLATHISFQQLSSAALGLSFANPWYVWRGHRTPFQCQAFWEYGAQQHHRWQCDVHLSRPYIKPYPHTYTQRFTLTRQHLQPPHPTTPIDACLSLTTYDQDHTNHPFYPTQGLKLHGEGKLILPLVPHAHLVYPQALLQASYFTTPSSSPWTLHLRGTLGAALPTPSSSPFGQSILADNPFAASASNLIHPSILPFRGHPVQDGPNPFATHAYGATASFSLRYRLLEKPLVYTILFVDTACTDQTFLLTMGAELRILTPLCIISGYVFYPSTQGTLGLRLRLMPIHADA